MKREIYGECIQGASHVRNGIVCQDSFKKVEVSEGVSLVAVADGHGSASCPYSKTGSVIAANVFCKIMKNMLAGFSDDMDFLLTYLNREGELKVAQEIDTEWKRRVWKVHTDNKREKTFKEDGALDRAAVYKQYGTTLLGLLLTPKFIFAFQLGDGDILYIDETDVQPVIEADKILGTETHSLSRLDSWKNAIAVIRIRNKEDEKPQLYLMSTDGFANSYRTQEDFYKTCRDYYALIRENGFKAVSENLRDWLTETSELGCGDDITVVMTYFE